MTSNNTGIKPVVFKDEMTRVTRTLSRDDKLNVVIGGTKAYTDGNTVVLPALDDTNNISNRQANVARGYVDHEAAHNRYTDIDGGWLKKAEENYGEFGEGLCQALEDVRIESHNIDKYPGSKVNLSATADATYTVIAGELDQYDVSDPKVALPLVVTALGRQALGYDMDSGHIETLKKVLPDDMLSDAQKMADEVVRAPTTEHAYNIMAAYCEKQDPPEQGDGGDGEEESDEGEGNSSGRSSGGGSGSNGTSASNGGGSDGDTKPIDAGLERAVEQALNNRDMYGEVPYLSDWEADEWLTRKNHEKYNHYLAQRFRYGSHEYYNNIKRDIGPHLSQIKSSFERYLMSKMARGWEGALEQGVLDPRRLAHVQTGSLNVYRRRDPIQELDTCVSLVVDMSGSMSSGRIKVAQQACIAMAEALLKLNVPCEIIGHTTGDALFQLDGDHGNSMTSKQYEELPFGTGRKRMGIYDLEWLKKNHHGSEPGKGESWIPEAHYGASSVNEVYKTLLATRWMQQRLVLFKAFDERLFESEPYLAAMSSMAGGGTIEGDTILKAYQRMLRRKEKKRVMVVLSDGMPGGYGPADEEAWTKKACEYIEADRHTHLMQIGIKSDAGTKYYSNVHVINEVSELAPTLFKNLKHILATTKQAS
jgi:cobalamin biosynthesis protein CobT